MAIRFREGFHSDTEIQIDGKHLQIISLLRAGRSYKEIGAAMGISDRRVSNLQDDLRHALHLSNRRLLFIWALQHLTLQGSDWVDPFLHPSGCECGAAYCALQAGGRAGPQFLRLG
jgi:DNA-binding CsgD family transcriptional regulator